MTNQLSYGIIKSEKDMEVKKLTYGWYWVAVIVIAIILELLTEQLVSVWFVPGAIAATVLDFFYPSLALQIILFLIISGAGIIFTKIYFSKNKRDTRTNIDAIIGEKCVVTEKIDNFAGCGQARVNGQIWSARGSSENDTFDVGESLTVVAIEGVKLICKK